MMYVTVMKAGEKTLQGLVRKEGKHYVSQCLNADVASQGDTRDEAIKNLQEALELYFEDVDVNEVLSIESPELVPVVLHA